MKVRIKETRIVTVNVQLEPGASKERAEQEIRKQLAQLPLARTTHIPMGGLYPLCVGGVFAPGSSLGTCEVTEEPVVEAREVIAVV